ncbi:site-specific DNA-methyltransferase [Aliiruegeria sabulilitoris]|uniref:site-specific DNA-methyltransferase n=1 Tax=Aliiruegeria sabulilitoris TaxID=1510458 RepID=UPI000A821A4A|nr:site-specific DNA-methyltransferase [Aliiruegeria sabulilitoris]
MQIEMMATERLVPYARNARTHPEWQIAQICASIAEFGFTNPILAAGNGEIIAGHGRLLAAQRMELAEVPVIVLDHLSDAQRRALIIADNKIAENAGWDEDLLRRELAALQKESFDLDLMGFSDAELEELLAGAPIEDEDGASVLPGDPDFLPEPPRAPVSVRGNIWLLGDHRLMCGDSTKRGDLEALCPDGPVDACWTDPPYNVNYEGTAGSIRNDNMGDTEFRRFLTDAFCCAFAVMKRGGPIYVAHADTEGFNFRGAFRDAGFKLSGCLVWVKPSLVLGRSDYQWRHEPILYGWKPGAAHKWFGGRAKTTVFEDGREPLRLMADGTVQVDVGDQVVTIAGENLTMETHDGSVLRFDKPARNGEHPTMKPVRLISDMLGNSTSRGHRVLDPFGGSGSTLIACQEMGRRARLMELDEKFCDVIVNRWQQFTGGEAILEGDGRSFEDIASSRARAA